MSNPSDTDIAWLAGLLEGEGYFVADNSPSRIASGRKPLLRVILEMTDKDVVERAHSVLAPSTSVTQRSREAPRQDTYRCRWNGPDAANVMGLVLPYMGKRRTQKFLESLRFPGLLHTLTDDEIRVGTAKNSTPWLAGLLEGEACFEARSRGKHNRPTLGVKLWMTDKDVIARAHKFCSPKSNVRTALRMDKRAKHQALFGFDAAGADAERIMQMVLPYMGERRTAKIHECLATPNLSHYPKARHL